MLYKRTGGNTTNLHKHLQKKHPSKVETEVESGEMDKFVKKELSVNIFFYIIYCILCFLLNINKEI